MANVEALEQSEEGTITCGASEGACWIEGYDFRMCGEYNFYECVRSDDPHNSCYDPCWLLTKQNPHDLTTKYGTLFMFI